jgi:hypothetical protein
MSTRCHEPAALGYKDKAGLNLEVKQQLMSVYL